MLLADTGIGLEDCVEELTRLVAETLGLSTPGGATGGVSNSSPGGAALAAAVTGTKSAAAAAASGGSENSNTGSSAASSPGDGGESPAAVTAKRAAVASLCRAMLRRVFSTTDPVYRKVQAGVSRALGTYLEAAAAAPMNAHAAAASAPRAAAACTAPAAATASGTGLDSGVRGGPTTASAASGVAAHRERSVRDQVGAALRPVGAEALAGEVCAWGAEVNQVLHLNLAVCRPYYEKLLSGGACNGSNSAAL